jgi:hypothetical protein
MLISAQAKAKAIAAHVEGPAALSDLTAVTIRIAAPMVKTAKTTTAGDRFRDGKELIMHPLAQDDRILIGLRTSTDFARQANQFVC